MIIDVYLVVIVVSAVSLLYNAICNQVVIPIAMCWDKYCYYSNYFYLSK